MKWRVIFFPIVFFSRSKKKNEQEQVFFFFVLDSECSYFFEKGKECWIGVDVRLCFSFGGAGENKKKKTAAAGSICEGEKLRQWWEKQ